MRIKTSVGNAPREIIWRKAAIIGGTWAASEIILGSFLHNVRAPFTGEALTGIGIIVLVSGHRLWPERGLLWRAGLVCALMKSISPSAVLFGPMAAIAAEGFLAEAGVRLLGANLAGYMLGGGAAMTWAAAHKIAKLLVVYGPDGLQVYLRGVDRLKSAFGSVSIGPWTPLLAAAAVYFAAGALAAAAGTLAADDGRIRSGASKPSPAPGFHRGNADPSRTYSVPALFFHFLFTAAVLGAGRRVPPAFLAVLVCVYGVFCARAYERVRSALRRRSIWAGIIIASVLAGAVLGSPAAGGCLALRAFLLTFAFAAIGSELMNPSVRAFAGRLGGDVLFQATEYAFSALPLIIADLPTGGEFARSPLKAIGRAVARAPFLIEELDGIRTPGGLTDNGAPGRGIRREPGPV